MKPVLFEAGEYNFDHNGIGVLYDSISCVVNEEHNGAFDLELEYPTDGDWFKEIKEQRIILAKPNDKDIPHAFRIFEVEKDLVEGVVYARASSITDDLAGNVIPTLLVKDVKPQQALDSLKNALVEPTRFEFSSDIDTLNSGKWELINPLQIIAGGENSENPSIVQLWGGDIKRTNTTIYLLSRRGFDKVTTIRPGKNIEGFNMVVSTTGTINKILPYFKYSPIKIPEYEMVGDYAEELVKQEKYKGDEVVEEDILTIGDVVTSDKIDNFATSYIVPVDYSSDDEINEQIDAYVEKRTKEVEDSATAMDISGFPEEINNYILELMNAKAANYFTIENPEADVPNIEIKADMVELVDSVEWYRYKNLETIQISDTVDVYVAKFDVDVEVTIQKISYDSIGERVLEITAGSARNTLAETIVKSYEKKNKELEDYVNTLENGVYNQITKTANGQSKRFTGYTEPDDTISSEGDIWFKIVGDGIVESYIYDGGTWTPMMTGTVVEGMTVAIDEAIRKAEHAEEIAQNTDKSLSDVVVNNGFTTLDDLFASKISSDNFSTMFFQEANTIGLTYQENGETKSIIMINSEGIPYIKGENIILNGDTIVDGTFTVTDTMLASDAVIKQLTASGIDAKDVRIINLDASSIVGGDLELTNGLRITNNGEPVLEVDATTGQVKITAPNLASKEDLDTKAEVTDMDALGEIVSSISADVNLKAGMSEFQALESAYNARVEQDIADKSQLAKDLATIQGRTTLVETIAGNNKIVTDFINTVITSSEEGIYIANEGAATGILISSDRISFMDNDVEVAFISNQTMQINHGIFVESATIADFKFEKIPGTTILGITWVGD